MDRLAELKERAGSLFVRRFGAPAEVFVAAPGRVNLIGEHTDYNEGYVFPAAIDRHVVVAAARAPDASKFWSEAFAEPAVFDVSEESGASGWARFPAGCAWSLEKRGHRLANLNGAVVSDLPMGSGVSSSAAMELAFLTLWNAVCALGIEPLELALVGQACEHEYVGVHCGVMDQMASALGREGSAMLIDTRTLAVQHRLIPPGISIVLCDTGVERSLAGSAYNQRLAECREAARLLGVGSLRDATMEGVDGTLAERDAVLHRRARHVVTENERCLAFSQALAEGDVGRLGTLMEESHASLRDDYEVSCRELDWMAESARLSPGCLGARMTGAGFGGACVALVESGRLGAFLQEVAEGYRSSSNGLEPGLVPCKAASGARLI